VAFGLWHLPITRRRREAFIVLSTLAAALMVAAVPFRIRETRLRFLCLIGGEVFWRLGDGTRS